jgi:hypothetical protein
VADGRLPSGGGGLDRRIFPRPDQLAAWLSGRTHVEVLPVHRNTPDWTLMSFWAHQSGCWTLGHGGDVRLCAHAIWGSGSVVAAVERDLAEGAWDERYGHLRQRDFRRWNAADHKHPHLGSSEEARHGWWS